MSVTEVHIACLKNVTVRCSGRGCTWGGWQGGVYTGLEGSGHGGRSTQGGDTSLSSHPRRPTMRLILLVSPKECLSSPTVKREKDAFLAQQ